MPGSPEPWSIHLQVQIRNGRPLRAAAPTFPGFGARSILYLFIHKMVLPLAEAWGIRIYIINVQEGPLPEELRP